MRGKLLLARHPDAGTGASSVMQDGQDGTPDFFHIVVCFSVIFSSATLFPGIFSGYI